MDHRRRLFLQGLAATSAACVMGLPGWAQGRQTFSNPLRIPPLLEGTLVGSTRTFDLTVRSGMTSFFEGVQTPTLGINGDYLGPTIRCTNGEDVTFRVRNTLSEPTTLHWHGLHLPAKADGGPHQVIQPGATWSPSFTIKQRASTCWYHSHLMGRTGEQVVRGLAGFFLIDDEETRALGLPSEYGVDDIPLVIQDRAFRSDGRFDYLTSMHDIMMGYQGDVVLVNGTASPYLQLRRRHTRLRILNGSNARFYNLGREDGADLLVIGSDGSLLERPAKVSQIRLAPGERAEILVDAEPNTSIVLMSYPDRVSGGGMMGINADTFPVIELRSARLEASALALPPRLIQLPDWPAQSATRTRTFTLEMGMMGGMAMGMGPGGMGMGGRMGMGMGPGAMRINGRTMDMRRIDERVPLGSREIWEIRNPSPIAHPFHIHDIRFLVLDRDGRSPLAHERGLKDTVVIDPGTSARVITEFSDYADPSSPYMYHCHILEHEDAGMMGQFVVV